jgi:hypothetical protein
MLASRLRPRSWDGPDRRAQIDVVQTRGEHFGRPGGGEDHEFACELRRLVHAALAQRAQKVF